MRNKPVLNDVFNQWLNGKGVLSFLTNNFDVPWKDYADGDILDLEYHGNRSGNKIIAPLVEKLLDENGISDANAIKLANLIFLRYGQNWAKLWDTLSFEYNPIENYRMTETEEISRNRELDGTKGATDTIAETLRKTGTIGSVQNKESSTEDTTNIDNSGNNSDSIYGFNSSNAVPSNESENSNTSETTSNGSISEDLTSTDTLNTTDTTNKTDTLSETTSEDETSGEERELTRSGNIGVTTSQQMIESERKLWDWQFFEVVFKDIDSITVLKVFGKDHGGLNDFVINTGYKLPIASADVLGGVKVGDNLNIEADGTLNAEAEQYELPEATADILGGIKVGARLSINNGVLSADDQSYTLPEASTDVLGGVKIGDNINVDQTGKISVQAPYVPNYKEIRKSSQEVKEILHCFLTSPSASQNSLLKYSAGNEAWFIDIQENYKYIDIDIIRNNAGNVRVCFSNVDTNDFESTTPDLDLGFVSLLEVANWSRYIGSGSINNVDNVTTSIRYNSTATFINLPIPANAKYLVIYGYPNNFNDFIIKLHN